MGHTWQPQQTPASPAMTPAEPDQDLWTGDWSDPLGMADAMGNSFLCGLADEEVCTPELDPEEQVCKPPSQEEQDAMVDAAVGDVQGTMETGLFDWWVSDDEANGAIDTLTALPPDLQGKAIEKMDKGTFDTMLSEVPTMDKDRFKSLFENTHDPERKLKLWAEYHKGQVAEDAALEKEKTKDDGGWWPFNDTAEEKENARLNTRRDEIVASTNKEIDDEVSFAMKQLAAGKLTEADVLSLAQRKNKEHEIEMKYNVNLVNDEGARKKDGTKICWDQSELTQIDNALARMPDDHVKHNPMLKEIRRSEIRTDDGVDKPNVGGDHSGGVIRIFDTGVNGLYRHTGDQPQSVDTNTNTNTPLTPLEETIVHEIGHDVHDQNADAFDRFKGSVGWQESQSDAAVKAAGLTDAQITALKTGNQSQVVVGGKVYQVDPYHTNADGTPLFVVYNDGAIPSTTNGATPNQTYGHDTWSYARTNPMDHFAESYQKAVHMPETLAHDLLDAPQARVASATMARDAAKGSLDTLKAQNPPPSADQLKAAEDALKAQEDALSDAKSDQGAQQTQWDILRKDIFHSDTATAEAVKRLEAKGVAPDKIADFKSKAGRLQTPDQIGVLEAGY